MSDEEELRAYLEETCHGLLPERSTCSYALDFLRTERANLLMSQRRVEHLLQVIEEVRNERKTT